MTNSVVNRIVDNVANEQSDTSMIRPSGLIIPIATPLTDSGKLDRNGQAELTRWLLANGADAIFINGSFGGFAFHSDAVQLDIATHVSELVEGRVPLFAGISDLGLTRVREQMNRLADLRLDGFVLLPPLYYHHSQQELERFFLQAADVATKPVILYENPKLCLNRLEPATIVALARHPNIVGVKHSSPDESEWLTLINADLPRERFALICGSEKSMARALQLGFDGITGGFHNVVPGWASELMKAARAGDFVRAGEIQKRINRGFRIFEVAGGWRGAAAALEWMGIASRIAPAPFDTPLSASELSEIHRILIAENFLRPAAVETNAETLAAGSSAIEHSPGSRHS